MWLRFLLYVKIRNQSLSACGERIKTKAMIFVPHGAAFSLLLHFRSCLSFGTARNCSLPFNFAHLIDRQAQRMALTNFHCSFSNRKQWKLRLDLKCGLGQCVDGPPDPFPSLAPIHSCLSAVLQFPGAPSPGRGRRKRKKANRDTTPHILKDKDGHQCFKTFVQATKRNKYVSWSF